MDLSVKEGLKMNYRSKHVAYVIRQ